MDELTRKRLKEEKGKEEERWRKTVELRVFYGNLKILIMLDDSCQILRYLSRSKILTEVRGFSLA